MPVWEQPQKTSKALFSMQGILSPEIYQKNLKLQSFTVFFLSFSADI
jgi:hypothetical protein